MGTYKSKTGRYKSRITKGGFPPLSGDIDTTEVSLIGHIEQIGNTTPSRILRMDPFYRAAMRKLNDMDMSKVGNYGPSAGLDDAIFWHAWKKYATKAERAVIREIKTIEKHAHSDEISVETILQATIKDGTHTLSMDEIKIALVGAIEKSMLRKITDEDELGVSLFKGSDTSLEQFNREALYYKEYHTGDLIDFRKETKAPSGPVPTAGFHERMRLEASMDRLLDNYRKLYLKYAKEVNDPIFKAHMYDILNSMDGAFHALTEGKVEYARGLLIEAQANADHIANWDKGIGSLHVENVSKIVHEAYEDFEATTDMYVKEFYPVAWDNVGEL